jgi:thiol reductant ABC exporter CydD subunit
MRADRRLLRSARATRPFLVLATALGIAAAGLAIAQARLLASAISRAVQDGAGLEGLGETLTGLALVLAGSAAVAWARELVAHRAAAAVKSDLRLRLLRRAVSLGPRRPDGASSAEVVALATRGVDALDGYFARYLPQVVLAVVLPLAVVASAVPADLIAGLTIATTLPLIVVFLALVGQATESRRRGRWRALSRLTHHFLDVVAGLPTLKVLGRAQAQVAALRRVTDEYRRESMGALRVAFLSAFVLEFFATLSVALVAVGVGLRLVHGGLDLQTALFVLLLAPEAYLPLRQLGAHYHASEEGLAAAGAAFAVIDAPPPPRGERRDVPDLRRGELRIEGVTVRQPGRDVLAPFRASLVVRPGEVVAIAGPSGAGKSTLLQAVLGAVSPDEGRVRVVGDGDAAAVSDLAPDAWWERVAWVPQEPFLFAGTVADNVRLAAPLAPVAAVRAALAAAGLPDVDPAAALGERGAGLSSGQRRRLAVARALVRDAPLLLLDEPTAGLDAAAERTVLAAVRGAARAGKAVLVVAHRPAALAAADRIVRLEWRTAPGAGDAPPAVRTPLETEPAAASRASQSEARGGAEAEVGAADGSRRVVAGAV